jgi:hypothetical protein
MDFDYAKNAIKVVGEPVQKVSETLKDVNPFSEGVVRGAPKAPLDVFDEVDEIVFAHLRNSY